MTAWRQLEVMDTPATLNANGHSPLQPSRSKVLFEWWENDGSSSTPLLSKKYFIWILWQTSVKLSRTRLAFRHSGRATTHSPRQAEATSSLVTKAACAKWWSAASFQFDGAVSPTLLIKRHLEWVKSTEYIVSCKGRKGAHCSHLWSESVLKGSVKYLVVSTYIYTEVVKL